MRGGGGRWHKVGRWRIKWGRGGRKWKDGQEARWRDRWGRKIRWESETWEREKGSKGEEIEKGMGIHQFLTSNMVLKLDGGNASSWVSFFPFSFPSFLHTTKKPYVGQAGEIKASGLSPLM